MKKIFNYLAIPLLLIMTMPSAIIAGADKATVFNPETNHRKVVTVGDARAFDGGYLLEVAYGYKESDTLGYSVATGYDRRLSRSISATQSTIYVTNTLSEEGTQLAMTDLGSKVFLIIEPTGSKKEIIMCTGLTSTTWTGCTRGLAFYGTSTTAVSDNQNTHSAGSQIIMSNVHYIFEELVDKDDDETIAGDKTFTGIIDFSNIPTSTTTLPTTNGQLATKLYVDTVGAGGFTSVNASTTNGLEVYGTAPETVGVNASSTGGLEFNTDGALQIKASSTGGVATDSNGLYIDTSDDFSFSGENTFSATTTFSSTISSKYFFGGGGADGALNVTSGTTTLDANSANVLVKNYTSINISAGAVLTISNPATTGTLLILKSTGNVTIAGTILMTGMGGAIATNGFDLIDDSTHYGATGGNSTGASAVGSAGTGGLIYVADVKYQYSTISSGNSYRGGRVISVGSGGGNGGQGYTGNGTIGTGGKGGGSVLIECVGALDFSGTITVNGNNGTNATNATIGGGPGGGGGGSAGMALIYYKTLTANTGTINAKGGSAGSGGNGQVAGEDYPGGAGGGGGGSWHAAGATGGAAGDGVGGAGGNGVVANNGAGSSGGGGGSGGGNGGAAAAQGTTATNHSKILQNVDFY